MKSSEHASTPTDSESSVAARLSAGTRFTGGQWIKSLVPVLLGVAALSVPMVMVSTTYLFQVGFRAMVYVALAQAWNLLAGYGGMIFLGTAAFVGVGEYTFIDVSNHGLAMVPAVLVAGLVSVVLALLISPALFRLRGLYFAVGTWAFAQALLLLVSTIQTFGGSTGLFLHASPPSYAAMYWYSLIVALATASSVFLVLRSRLSVSLRGVRDDEDVAREMGVRVFRTKLIALLLAALVMGVVGALQSLNDAFVEPSGAFSLSWTVYPLVAVIIGGMATRFGPWLGALVIVGLAEVLANYSGVHDLITGIILIAVIRFLPRGVWGSVLKVPRQRFRSRRAQPISEEMAK